MSKRHKYSRIMTALFKNCWAILPEKLEAITELVAARVEQGDGQETVDFKPPPAPVTGPYRLVGDIAVLELFGVISQRMNLLTAFSGGTSTELFGQAFDQVMDDPAVRAVVLEVDSPGGEVYGVAELSDKIFAARGQKPIIAVANSLAASGAYWIASAADQLVVTPSGEVGSVGVYCLHADQTEMNKMLGVKYTLIRQPVHKAEGHPDEPLTEVARAGIQNLVDQSYDDFVAALARNRAVSAQQVRDNFGQGRLVKAEPAVAAQMADRTATLEEILTELGDTSNPAGQRPQEALMSKTDKPAETAAADESVESKDKTANNPAEPVSQPVAQAATQPVGQAAAGTGQPQPPAAAAGTGQPQPPAAAADAVQVGVEQERRRARTIRSLALPDQQQLADELIEAGRSVEEAKTTFLQAGQQTRAAELERLRRETPPAAGEITEEIIDSPAPVAAGELATAFARDPDREDFLTMAGGDQQVALEDYTAFVKAKTTGRVKVLGRQEILN